MPMELLYILILLQNESAYISHWYVTCLFHTSHMKCHLSNCGQNLDNLSGVRPRDPRTPESRLWWHLHLLYCVIPSALYGKTVGCSFNSGAYRLESRLHWRSCSVSTLLLLLIALLKAWKTVTSSVQIGIRDPECCFFVSSCFPGNSW